METLTFYEPELSAEELSRLEARRLDIMRQADSPAEALEPSPLEVQQFAQSLPNDSEHARHFVSRHRDCFRYVHAMKRWLIWDESAGWNIGIEPTVLEMARCYVKKQLEVSRTLLANADDETFRKMIKGPAGYGDAGKLNALIHLTKSDPRVIVDINEVDSDPWLVGVTNGILDLSTCTFQRPMPTQLVTKRLGCEYVQSATCPAWEEFLAKVQPDPEIRAFLQRWAGYCLTGIVTEHKFTFSYGMGSNGKSTFLETLYALHGDYAQSAPEKLIMTNQRGGDPSHEVARLPGVRFLLGCEMSEGMRINESIVKSLVSGDTLTGEAKYCTPFDFNPVAKLNLFGNHRPIVSGTDHGFWRRVILIPWQIQISESEKDMTLPGRLRKELPGILNWCLKGLADWQKVGLRLPASIEAATAEYKSASDILGDFIADHLDLEAPSCRLPLSEVYKKYQEWAIEGGIRNVWSARTFNSRMEERRIERSKSNGEKCWLGIAWQSNL